MKRTLLALAILSLASPAFAQSKPKVPNPYKDLTEAECTADKGAIWKPAETWTRSGDGKIRNTKARCAFDSKTAKGVLAKTFQR